MDLFKATNKLDQARDGQLCLLRMVESRIVEIVQIEEEIKKKTPKLFHQRLPRFMRRRAASHNPHRIPKWFRATKSKARDRRRLYAYRQRIRFNKRKRILSRHARHRYKDPSKTLLHKWFAKRFRMDKRADIGMEFVPIHNNTKNFRNLYRQTRYGCAYISMAHLIGYRVNSGYTNYTIDALNTMTNSVSGFTFAARALESGRYEVVIHLYDTEPNELDDKADRAIRADRQKSSAARKHLCPAIVSNHKTHWIMWVPRINAPRVDELLKATKLPHVQIAPRDAMRMRLVGPDSRGEAMRIADNVQQHQDVALDVELRLPPSSQFGPTIGRFIDDRNASFTYYQTDPVSVDIVFRNKREGRMLWHQLINCRAHLVGGKRDVDELLEKKYRDVFHLSPDYTVSYSPTPAKRFDDRRRSVGERSETLMSQHKS